MDLQFCASLIEGEIQERGEKRKGEQQLLVALWRRAQIDKDKKAHPHGSVSSVNGWW